jgi:hypothetical protein
MRRLTITHPALNAGDLDLKLIGEKRRINVSW